MWASHKALADADIHFMIYENMPLAEVVESYRRQAIHGTPHSLEDLEVMSRWVESHGVGS